MKKILMSLMAMSIVSFAGLAAFADPASAEEVQETQALLEDGIYQAEGFRFEGGSGRLTIDCRDIQIIDGIVYGDLEFGSSHIIYVDAQGERYEPVQQSEKLSCYQIPITPDQEQEIIACTTAMSTPHEVTYTIYCGIGEKLDAIPGEDPGSSAESMPEVSEEMEDENDEDDAAVSTDSFDPDQAKEPPQIQGLTFSQEIPFRYAKCVHIFEYEDGYKYFDIYDTEKYLLIPEEGIVPDGLDADVTILQAPFENAYVAATAAMALIHAADAMDQIRLSSQTAENWYVQEAAERMQQGEIVYAGKYSEPDFETLIGQGCDLAIESTMIFHSPKIKEMIEKLGIPVFIDRSSYEEHPLGRAEWARVYGQLFGHEQESDQYFAGQEEIIEQIGSFENTGKTVAFFYVNASGSVVVRTPQDYVPRMIEMAGGNYIYEQDQQTAQLQHRSTVEYTMEQFYADTMDADYIIYNSTIDSPLKDMKDLLAKSPLFGDFKAVKDGNVWCADRYIYQASDTIAEMIRDFHQMLTTGEEEGMTFLSKVQ